MLDCVPTKWISGERKKNWKKIAIDHHCCYGRDSIATYTDTIAQYTLLRFNTRFHTVLQSNQKRQNSYLPHNITIANTGQTNSRAATHTRKCVHRTAKAYIALCNDKDAKHNFRREFDDDGYALHWDECILLFCVRIICMHIRCTFRQHQQHQRRRHPEILIAHNASENCTFVHRLSTLFGMTTGEHNCNFLPNFYFYFFVQLELLNREQ